MRNIVILFCALTLMIACGKKNSNDGSKPSSPAPGKSSLIFPQQNSLCNPGSVISTTQASIILNWNASSNTDNYEVFIKNLLNNSVSTQTAITNQLSVNLLRNTPYSWYVVSKSNNTTATTISDIWKFYMAGSGITTYSPFPANIVTPTFGQSLITGTSSINLTWIGDDVDNDIIGYDIYFGATSTPPLFKSNVTDMFLNNVSLVAKTTYYWKIVTKDSRGNASDSGLYRFLVN